MTGQITIRRAGAEDAPAVTALTNAAYAKWIPVIGRKPLPMTVDYVDAIEKHMIDLAVIDGSVAALVEMIDKGEHLMIENLAVAPEHQGKGIGKFLLQRAETVAQSLNLPMVRLLTNAKFASNVDFYLGNGYLIDREEPFMGGTTIHMLKTIA